MKYTAGVRQKKSAKGIDRLETGFVILSRFSSRRLPGKAMMEIHGKKTLEYIIERLLQVTDRQHIVLATSVDESDDPVEQLASAHAISCFRGSLENVAERFCEAANEQNWDFAVRINGDNIFVDIPVLKELLDITRSDRYDFVSNVKGRTFPAGMSIEIVRLSYYKSLLGEINRSEKYKEHVTAYLYDHDEGKDHYYYLNKAFPEAAGIQLALDTVEDFNRTRKIIDQFTKPHYYYNLKEILMILEILKREENEPGNALS